MYEKIFGLGVIVGGIAMIAFRKKLAHQSIEGQNEIFSFLHFGEREIKGSTKVIALLGLSLIALGIVKIFDIQINL